MFVPTLRTSVLLNQLMKDMNRRPRRTTKVCREHEDQSRPSCRVISRQVDLSFRRIEQFEGWRQDAPYTDKTNNVTNQHHFTWVNESDSDECTGEMSSSTDLSCEDKRHVWSEEELCEDTWLTDSEITVSSDDDLDVSFTLVETQSQGSISDHNTPDPNHSERKNERQVARNSAFKRKPRIVRFSYDELEQESDTKANGELRGLKTGDIHTQNPKPVIRDLHVHGKTLSYCAGSNIDIGPAEELCRVPCDLHIEGVRVELSKDKKLIKKKSNSLHDLNSPINEQHVNDGANSNIMFRPMNPTAGRRRKQKSPQKFLTPRNKRVIYTTLYGDKMIYGNFTEKPKDKLLKPKRKEKKLVHQTEWNSDVVTKGTFSAQAREMNTLPKDTADAEARERSDCKTTNSQHNHQTNSRQINDVHPTQQRIKERNETKIPSLGKKWSSSVPSRIPYGKTGRPRLNSNINKTKIKELKTMNEEHTDRHDGPVYTKQTHINKYNAIDPKSHTETLECTGKDVNHEDGPIVVSTACYQRRALTKPPVPVFRTKPLRTKSRVILPRVNTFCKKLMRKPRVPQWKTISKTEFDALPKWRQQLLVMLRAPRELGVNAKQAKKLARYAIQASGLDFSSEDYCQELMKFIEAQNIRPTEMNEEKQEADYLESKNAEMTDEPDDVDITERPNSNPMDHVFI